MLKGCSRDGNQGMAIKGNQRGVQGTNLVETPEARCTEQRTTTSLLHRTHVDRKVVTEDTLIEHAL